MPRAATTPRPSPPRPRRPRLWVRSLYRPAPGDAAGFAQNEGAGGVVQGQRAFEHCEVLFAGDDIRVLDAGAFQAGQHFAQLRGVRLDVVSIRRFEEARQDSAAKPLVRDLRDFDALTVTMCAIA